MTPSRLTPAFLHLSSRRQFLERSATASVAAAAFLALPLTGCMSRHGVSSQPLGPAGDVSGAASLRVHAAAAGMLYGCAVNPQLLASDQQYAQLVRDQTSIVVAENSMKWAALRPTSTTYSFDGADAVVAFAESNRIKIRGHNLCWHEALPAWFAPSASAANASQLLTDHIQTVAGRYAGRMHSWDVVNEAINPKDGRADGLRLSPWLSLIGTDYIELAFQTARKADPQALLTYNDFGMEEESVEAEQKRAAILMMLRRLHARNIPIDALGIQSHVTATPGNRFGAGLTTFLRNVRELGLQVFLSELDVDDRLLPQDNSTRDQAVAATTTRYLDLALAEPAVTALLSWGITDRYGWLARPAARPDHLPERALPFDFDYNAKSAFFSLRDAFDHRPQSGLAAPPAA